MAMFTSGNSERPHESSGRHTGKESTLSIVASGMRIVGELETSGVVKIEGVVEGSVRAEQEVLVAKEGLVQGDVQTAHAVIGGRVVGSIHGYERVEIQQDSVVQGDVMTKRLVVHEGGEVNGTVRMGEAAAAQGQPGLQMAEGA